MSEKINVAEIFGENVFNDTVMKERLPKNVYKNLKLAMKGEKELQLADADVIANEMKDWAIEKGATHYTAELCSLLCINTAIPVFILQKVMTSSTFIHRIRLKSIRFSVCILLTRSATHLHLIFLILHP